MLMKSILLLAAADLLDPQLPVPTSTDPSPILSREVIIIACIVLILGILLFLIAYFTRKSRHGRSDSRTQVLYKADKKKASESSPDRVKMRRKRRRHPDNLPRNPTLGETGGLPPARSDEAAASESSGPAQ